MVNIDHKLTFPRVTGLIDNDTNSKSTLNACREQMILDPIFPAMERTAVNNSCDFFGQHFRVPFQTENNAWYVRTVTTEELLYVYSITFDRRVAFPTNIDTVIDDLLPFSIPWTFRDKVMSNYNSNILESFTNSNTIQCNTAQCYLNSTALEILD